MGTADSRDPSELFKWDGSGPTHVHALIALTPCTPHTGMFRLIKGSQGPKPVDKTRMEEWEVTTVNLMPGDVLMWRGDTTYLASGGKGGRWALFSYILDTRPPRNGGKT